MTYDKNDPAASILEAAMDTIYTEKISGARLRQVAKRAGMSQGNLHYYYPAKDDLYQALLDHLLETFIQDRKGWLEDPRMSPPEKLRVFLNQERELILRGKEIKVFFDFWVQGTGDPRIRAKIRALYARWRADIQTVINEGVQSGVFAPGKAGLAPVVLASLMDGAALQYLMDDQAFDLSEYFATAYNLALGLLTP